MLNYDARSQKFRLAEDLLSSMVDQYRRGVKECTYDPDDPVAAADQIIYDQEQEVRGDMGEHADLLLYFLDNADFRRELIRVIQAEIDHE